MPAYLIFAATMTFTWYIRIGTCSSYLLVWLGLGPMHVSIW